MLSSVLGNTVREMGTDRLLTSLKEFRVHYGRPGTKQVKNKYKETDKHRKQFQMEISAVK